MSETSAIVNDEPVSDETVLVQEPLVAALEGTSEVVQERTGRMQRLVDVTRNAGHVALRSSQISLALLELSPANEVITMGAGVAALGTTQNPITTGLVYGAASLGMESIGALSAAPLLGTNQSKRFTTWLNEKIDQHRKEKNKDELVLSKSTKIVAAVYGGSVLAMALETREDPTRTVAQNRKFGLWTSVWLGGVCAVEGAFVAAGVNLSLDNPRVAIPAAAGVAAAYVGNRFRKQHNKEGDMVGAEEQTDAMAEERAPIRYDLTPEELVELEREMVDSVKEQTATEGMVAAWISPRHKFANFVRMHEAASIPGIQEVSEEDEEHTLFLAIVDTRPGAERVVHGAAITGLSYDGAAREFLVNPDHEDGMTGFYTVDSLIERGNFTANDFYDYYRAKGLEPSRSISVETNFRIGERAKAFEGVGTADLSYLMFFNLLQKAGSELGKAAVFASINHDSQASFERVGLDYEPLMGRTDLDTEEGERGLDSLPVAINYDEKVAALLKGMGIELPETFF